MGATALTTRTISWDGDRRAIVSTVVIINDMGCVGTHNDVAGHIRGMDAVAFIHDVEYWFYTGINIV